MESLGIHVTKAQLADVVRNHLHVFAHTDALRAFDAEMGTSSGASDPQLAARAAVLDALFRDSVPEVMSTLDAHFPGLLHQRADVEVQLRVASLRATHGRNPAALIHGLVHDILPAVGATWTAPACDRASLQPALSSLESLAFQAVFAGTHAAPPAGEHDLASLHDMAALLNACMLSASSSSPGASAVASQLGALLSAADGAQGSSGSPGRVWLQGLLEQYDVDDARPVPDAAAAAGGDAS